MTQAVQLRKGTTAEHTSFTGLQAEATVDTTKKTLVVHDGSTAGGIPLSREDLSNSNPSNLTSIAGADTASGDFFVVYDVSASAFKKITRAELNNAMEQDALASVAITGGTINGTTIGGTTAAAGSFTTLTASGNVTLSGGTANGVLYLNGSKVATSGSALTFDGTNTLRINGSSAGYLKGPSGEILIGEDASAVYVGTGAGVAAAIPINFGSTGTTYQRWQAGGTEQMRLDSTGLGIGTSSPSARLTAKAIGNAYANSAALSLVSTASQTSYITNVGGALYVSNDGSTDQLVLSSSGNLGLGVTPSAGKVGTYTKNFEIGAVGNTIRGDGSSAIIVAANAYYDATDSRWEYAWTNLATNYTQQDGIHKWFTAASGTAGNAITFTQAMTLDASGNLGVGETAPSTSLGGSRGIVVKGSTDTQIRLQNTNTGSASSDGFLLSIDSSANALAYVWNYENAALIFGTNNTERARITSGGYFKASNNGAYPSSTSAYHEFYQTNNNEALVVRTTNASQTSATLFVQAERNTTNNTFYAIDYYNGGATAYKFRVADSGDVTNTNGTYGTISDAKMKTDIVDAGSQWADIKAIRFRKFKMKDDPSGLLQLGVVAQELEQTSPGLVDEHVDRDAEGNDLGTTTKSVKTSILLMKAAKALQEAMARIETLEAKVSALEGN